MKKSAAMLLSVESLLLDIFYCFLPKSIDSLPLWS